MILPRRFQNLAIILVFYLVIVNGLAGRLPADAIGPKALLDNPDSVHIGKLNQSGMSDLAIDICRSRQKISDGVQMDASARWAILLMESIASKIATELTIEALDDIPNKFREIENVAQEYAESPRSLWVAFRAERCHWIIMQRLLASYQAAPTQTQVRDWTLREIRESLSRIEKLQLQIRNASGRASSKNSGPSPVQWISLLNDTWLLQADLLLIRAMFYPAKSTERIAAATEMMSVIDKALQQISTQWVGRPYLEMARCRALLLLDRAEESLSEIKKLKTKLETPNEQTKFLDTRWTESLAVLGAQASRELGQFEASKQWIQSAGGWTRSPDLALEHFAILVANANRDLRSERLLQDALQAKEEISLLFGTYWKHRADAYLVSNAHAVSNGKSDTAATKNAQVELLMSEARQQLAAKQNAAAIEKLRQAETAAANLNDSLRAFDIAIAIAAVYATDQDQMRSQEEFYRAAIAYPKSPKAPDAALMSVQSVDRITATDDAASAILEKRLSGILETWPTTRQADEACKRLDQFLTSNHRWLEVSRLWQKQIRRKLDSNSNDEIQKTMMIATARYLLIQLLMNASNFDRALVPADFKEKNQAELDQLKLLILGSVPASESGGLSQFFQRVEAASGWPKSALWPIVASDADNRQSWVPRIFADLENGEPDWLTTADDATRIAFRWSLTDLLFEHRLNEMLKEKIESDSLQRFENSVGFLKRLNKVLSLPSALNKKVVDKLEQCLALYESALDCWKGSVEKGRNTLDTLQRTHQRNAWWIYKSARILASIPAERQRAVELFRVLANGFPAGSDAWWEARARTVQTYRLSGNSKAADDLSSLLRATYPNISRDWKERLDP